jgi:hypothetical protein
MTCLLLALSFGCDASPELHVIHAELAGDEVLVQTQAYTAVYPTSFYPSINYDFSFYLLSYSSAAAEGAIVHPFNVATVPLPNTLEASYSHNRVVLTPPPFNSEMCLVGRDDGKSWRTIRDWQVDGFDGPPLGVSNDGRFVAVKDGVYKVTDTENLQPVDLPGLSAMFERAAKIEQDPWRPLMFTQRLGYVIVKSRDPASDGSRVFMVDGKSFSRDQFYAAIDRKTGEVIAIPISPASTAKAGFSGYYGGAGESQTGELLLYYFERSSKPEILDTIRDQDLKVRFQIRVPTSVSATGEPVANSTSWDPTGHRILFYTQNLNSDNKEPLKTQIFDYESRKLTTFYVDVASAFRRSWFSFVPK